MKTYKVQARVGGKYLKYTLDAENDMEALSKFSQKVSNGEVEIIDEDFYNKSQTIITYEEINVESGKSTIVEKSSTSGT